MSLYLMWGIVIGSTFTMFVSSCACGFESNEKESIKTYLSAGWATVAALFVLSIVITISVHMNGYPLPDDDPRPTPIPTIVELGR